ncbi:hypothetical protein CJ030_MR8G021793 [Morella rubra]|uniref:Endonuclease/exonuclease/phosphatase domain-containing protein n=1 Tax=Morella rubra TaxID=262757 RepID=A0A6A1UVW2_9ROSI|nr:hypothetical protein CJ030_MR8G021793 [Morella rubra]
MRRFLASAAADASTTTMSSRPFYRGGRRRGFSDGPYTDGRGQGVHIVTGDSHFRSVRDANLGLRRGDSGSFADHTGFRPPPLNPRAPPYTQNAQFRQSPRPSRNIQSQRYRQPPPYNNSNVNQSQQFRQHPPFDQNQAFRPPQQVRQKPLDYRNWEYGTQSPRPLSERFIVLSYNILADYLAINHRSKLYFHIPQFMLDWEWRKRNILFELGLWSADVMCFQEVDRFQELKEDLKLRGYNGIWKMRTGMPVDGCAIFWRTSRFKLLHEESIEFNKFGLRDNVAQICVLEMVNQNFTQEPGAQPISSTGSSKVVISNIHVLYNPKRGEIKLGQVRVLLNRAHSVSKLWDDAPVILCGDFNCTPKSPLYNFISERKLDLSGVLRDKVSGQTSAEIPAPRQYYSNAGPRSANIPIQNVCSTDGKETDIKLSESVSDQKLSNPDCSEKNFLAMNHSQPQCVSTALDVSAESCTEMQSGKDDGVLHDEVGEETQQNAVDGFKEFCGSTSRDSADGSTGDSSTSYSKGGFHVNYMHDEIHNSHPVASDPREVISNVTYTGDSEKVNVPSHSNNSSLREDSESNEKVDFDNCTDSFLENHHATTAKIDPEHVDPFSSEISSSEASCQTSFVSASEVFPPGNLGNTSSHQFAHDDYPISSSQSQANISCLPTSNDLIADEKLDNLSLNEVDRALAESGDRGEDESTFLSALCDAEDAFPSDLSQLRSNPSISDHSKELGSIPHDSPLNSLSNEVEDDLSQGLDSEAVAMDSTAYDPSLWTPMEIETATGNADCTLLEHPLMLSSVYTEVKDCSGTRDSNGEPLATSYNRCFLGTVDYIWRSEGLQTVRVLAPMQKQGMQWTPGFPTKKCGSDHIALAAELVLVKDRSNDDTKAP